MLCQGSGVSQLILQMTSTGLGSGRGEFLSKQTEFSFMPGEDELTAGSHPTFTSTKWGECGMRLILEKWVRVRVNLCFGERLIAIAQGERELVQPFKAGCAAIIRAKGHREQAGHQHFNAMQPTGTML